MFEKDATTQTNSTATLTPPITETEILFLQAVRRLTGRPYGLSTVALAVSNRYQDKSSAAYMAALAHPRKTPERAQMVQEVNRLDTEAEIMHQTYLEIHAIEQVEEEEKAAAKAAEKYRQDCTNYDCIYHGVHVEMDDCRKDEITLSPSGKCEYCTSWQDAYQDHLDAKDHARREDGHR